MYSTVIKKESRPISKQFKDIKQNVLQSEKEFLKALKDTEENTKTGILKENISQNHSVPKEEEDDDIVTLLNPGQKYTFNEVKRVPMKEVEEIDDYLNFDQNLKNLEKLK